MSTGQLKDRPDFATDQLCYHIVLGVGVGVGNDVGEGKGVGVTRGGDISDPAMPKAILRTTNTLMIQAMIRFRLSCELRTTPPVTS